MPAKAVKPASTPAAPAPEAAAHPLLRWDAGLAVAFVVLDTANNGAFNTLVFILFFFLALWRMVTYFRAVMRAGSGRNRPLLLRAWAAPILFILAFFGSHRLTVLRVRQSETVGLGLVAVLDRYAADHGHYPEALDLLAPDYLVQVPTTRMGIAWNQPFLYKRLPDGEAASPTPADLDPGVRPFALAIYFQPNSLSVYNFDHKSFALMDLQTRAAP